MKQVIVVNSSLELPCGKLAAQVAHAAVAAFLSAKPEAQRAWLEVGMPKVVLEIDNEEGLHRLEAEAKERGLPAYVIADAGRTVVAAGTVTCVGIGPAEKSQIDSLTGSLRLLR